MIKAVFFDFDGVLTTDFNATGTVCNNLCAVTPRLSAEKVTECYGKHCRSLLLGGTFADVWNDFCACVGTEISRDVLETALRTAPKNEEMFALAESLRGQFCLGIITDNTLERMELLSKEMKLPELFDPIIVSAAVHVSKHDGTTTIFDAALKAAGCTAEESVFIDNQQRNLATPAGMGIQTYWHDDAKNDVAALGSALRKIVG